MGPVPDVRPKGDEAVIAYLNTEYPSLSHTFIEREVRALRQRGFEVQTFSIRPPGKHATLGGHHAKAAEETFAILAKKSRLLTGSLRALVASPLAWCRALAASMKLSPDGIKSRVTHLAYAAEAFVLAGELKRRGIEHVHVHMANNGAAVAKLACVYDLKLRYSLSIHGSAEFFHVDSWTLAAKVSDAVFVRCISDFCKAQVMIWTSPAIWDRFHVVHCGIDPEQFVPGEKPADGPLRLLTVGRLHPIKGYPLLLDACQALSDAKVEWSLDMVGDGGERARLETQAKSLGIASRVKFSGAVGQDKIQRHFDEADVMVISSFMEGVPVVLMEAMAKGLVVVSTNVGGIPELVDQGKSGVLVTPGSSARLAEALMTCARERDRFPALRAAGRAKIESEFTVGHVADGMAALFARYAGQRPGVLRQENQLENA